MQFKQLAKETLLLLKKEDEIEQFIKIFSNDKIYKLKRLGRVHLYDPAPLVKNYDNVYTREKIDAMNGIYGADEIKETLVSADLDGETLVFNPIMARYGDKWYIVSLEGSAFNTLGIGNSKQAFVILKGDLNMFLWLYQH